MERSVISRCDALIGAAERAAITLRVILGRLHEPQDDQQRASVARVRFVIDEVETAIANVKGCGARRHVHADCPFCICEPTR